MANDNKVSVDEFLNNRKNVVTDKGHVLKGVIQTDEKGAAPSTFNKETGETRYTMTTEQEDRDKDIVLQDGLDWSQFEKNPAAPFAHRSYDFPIGAWKDLTPVLNGRPKRHDGTLVPTKGDPVADRYIIHAAAGTIRACSIGFMPKLIQKRPQAADSYKWPGYEIQEAEVWECSPCLIPANPGALAKAATEHGILPQEFLAEILDKWTAVDGLVLPREAFEEERAKHVAGKTFSFGGRTFKALDNGLSVAVTPEREKAEEGGLLQRLAKAFGFTDDPSKDAEAVKAALQPKAPEPEPDAPEGDAEPTAEEKAKAEAEAKAAAEELDDDIRELEAHLTAKSVRVDLAA